MVRGRAAQRRRRPALGLRGLRPPPAARPPLRRGGRHRPAARRAGGLPLRPEPSWSSCARPASPTSRPCDFLESYRFSGDIWGYAEGDCYFPGSPILVVEGTFAEAVVLETLVLSILNHDCAIAAAASRMVHAAGGRPLIEMGSRRTHERAAVASARAAYIAGFASTSQPRRPGTTTASRPAAPARTRSRCCTTASARRSRPRSTRSAPTPRCSWTPTTWPPRCGTAVEVAGPGLGAVRIDSGDLPLYARQVRDAARLARRHRAPGSWSPATSTSTPSPRWPPRPWTATAWAPRWSPAPARRPPRWSTSWWPGPTTTARGPLRPVAKRSVGKPSARRPQVGRARDRPRRHGRRRAASSTRRPSPAPETGRCCGSWCAAARSSAASRSTPPATRHRAARRRAARARPAAVPRLPGHPHHLHSRHRITAPGPPPALPPGSGRRPVGQGRLPDAAGRRVTPNTPTSQPTPARPTYWPSGRGHR